MKLLEFNEFIRESLLLEYDQKDADRIKSLWNRSGQDLRKAVRLAQNMAKSIKNAKKAYDRGVAAQLILGYDDNEVSKVFFQRAQELGINLDREENIKNRIAAPPASKRDVIKPSNPNNSAGRKRGRSRPWAILPIGMVNLKTGKCKYFNVYDTWAEGDTTVEVWQDQETGRYKLIFGSGKTPTGSIGHIQNFMHDQTHGMISSYRGWKLVDWTELENAEGLIRHYGKSAPGYVYK